MRKYRTIVIDFKRVIRRGGVALLALAVTVFAIYGAGSGSPEKILSRSIPIVASERFVAEEYINDLGSKLIEGIIGFLPFSSKSVINASIPVAAAMSDSVLFDVAETTQNKGRAVESSINSGDPKTEDIIANIPEENRAPIKSIDAAQKISQDIPVAIGNETSYGINIGEMLASRPDINMGGDGPKVLITHTHATESYAPEGASVYDITASDRSDNRDKNVVAVGRRMKAVLEEYGIETIHDEVLHDAPSFNGSYAHSLKTVEEYMEKYPSIQIVFDIHRDSIVYDDNTKAKTVTEINGNQAAQLMFVVGTDENGLDNPNWRSNMKAALHFQTAITKKYPKLMRHINLRKERFNGHTSNASMIIEVGTSGNSLNEALFSIELAAECIADYLNDIN